MKKQLAAIIEREGVGYVSLCPELDIASQGDTIEEARENLQEAVELFFETASESLRDPSRGLRWVSFASSRGSKSAPFLRVMGSQRCVGEAAIS
jgi:predicted RNase H-like HicB family nuclease